MNETSCFLRAGGSFSEQKSIKIDKQNDTETGKVREAHFYRFGFDIGGILASENGAKRFGIIFEGLLERHFFGQEAPKDLWQRYPRDAQEVAPEAEPPMGGGFQEGEDRRSGSKNL